MRLSTRTRYGLRLLVDIARAQEKTSRPIPLYPISIHQDISFKYLEQICRVLNKSGYLRGKRGPDGGHRLTAPPGEIPLGEVIRILEDDMNLTDCCLYETGCSRTSFCPTKQLWQDLRQAIIDKLNTYTLADLTHKQPACLLEEELPATRCSRDDAAD